MAQPKTVKEFADARCAELKAEEIEANKRLEKARKDLLGDPTQKARLEKREGELAKLIARLNALPADAPLEEREALTQAIAQAKEDITQLEKALGTQKIFERTSARFAALNRQIETLRSRIATSPTGADAEALAKELTAAMIASYEMQSELLELESQVNLQQAALDLAQKQYQRLTEELRAMERLAESEAAYQAHLAEVLKQLEEEPLSQLSDKATEVLAALDADQVDDDDEENGDEENGDAEDGDAGDEDGDADGDAEGDEDEGGGDENGDDNEEDEDEEEPAVVIGDPITNLEAAVALAGMAQRRVASDLPEDLREPGRDRVDETLEGLEKVKSDAQAALLAVADQQQVTHVAPPVIVARLRFDNRRKALDHFVRTGSEQYATAIRLFSGITTSKPLTAPEAAALANGALTTEVRKAAAPDHIWMNLVQLQRARQFLTRLTEDPQTLVQSLNEAETNLVSELSKDAEAKKELNKRLDDAFKKDRLSQFSESAGPRLLFVAVHGT